MEEWTTYFVPHESVERPVVVERPVKYVVNKKCDQLSSSRGVIEKKINKQRPRSSAVRGERETEGMGGCLMSVRPSMSTWWFTLGVGQGTV